MEFSWKRGALHVGIAVVIFLGAAFALVATDVVKNAEKFGEGCGRFLLVLIIGGLGVSWLFQTGHKLAAKIILAVVASLFGVAALVGLFFGLAARPTPLNAAEKAPLQVEATGGTKRLVHAGLGFSLLHPGDAYELLPPTLIEAAFSSSLDVHGSAYLDDADTRILMVLESSYLPGSRAELVDMISGVRRGLAPTFKALTGEATELKVDRDDLDWHDGTPEGHSHFTNGAAHLRIDVHGLTHDGKHRLIFLIGVTINDDTLGPILASYKLEPAVRS